MGKSEMVLSAIELRTRQNYFAFTPQYVMWCCLCTDI